LYEVLRAVPGVHLVALADTHRALAERLAAPIGAQSYDDCRQAIVESAAAGVEVVFAALPPFQAEEYLPIAAERGLPVFALPPVARRFEAAVELTEAFARTPGASKLVIARPWRLGPAGDELGGLQELTGRIHAAHVEVVSSLRAADGGLGWRGESRRAGGGVLLHEGYEPIDALVNLLGVPDEAFATVGYAAEPESARSHDTEDAASVILRYPDDRTAAASCRRGGGRDHWSITLCGARQTVVVEPGGVTVSAADAPSESSMPLARPDRLRAAVGAFVAALSSGAPALPSQIRDHLPTMVTIQAAYLSARTGQPVSPGRLLTLAERAVH